MSNNKKSTKYIPIHCDNTPYAGPQKTATIKPNQPVYSNYTSELVGYGPIPYGVPNDAPQGNPNYKKTFQAINVDIYGNYMVHRYTR